MSTRRSKPRVGGFLSVSALACAAVLSVALTGCVADSSGDTSVSAATMNDYAEVGGKNVDDIAKKIAATRKQQDAPHADLGIVLVTGTEGAMRDAVGAQEAAESLGWTVQTVDAAGDVQKMRSAMSNFVNQKKDAIIMVALPTASVAPELAAAKKADIPVINIAAVDEYVPGVQAQYAVSAADVGEAAADRLLEVTEEGDKVAMLTTPSIAAQRATDEPIREALEAGGRVVIEKNINTANLAADVKTNVNAILDANPDLAVIWADVSAEPGIITPILKQRSLCGTVKVYGQLFVSQTIDSIRGDGCVTGTIASPTGVMGWAAVDQIAQYLADGTEPIKDLPTLEDAWGLQLENGPSVHILEKSDLDTDSTALTPEYDYRSFFKTLWAEQFGTDAK